MKPLTVFIFSLLFLVGCNQSSVQHNTELEESIYSIVEDKSNSEVSIKSLEILIGIKQYSLHPILRKKV